MVAYSATHQHKRHGKHQKHTKHFLKVYWPYMPLATILIIGLVFSALWQPRTKPGVLAYATSISQSGLLSATNQDRVSNGVAALKLNSKLNQAAQAKANDMVARNYWSHNTPDGKPPWYFIDKYGYAYTAAGENLAYGFATSADTVAGWMNSPSHKANMLNSTFKEVGFGFANSSNFQGTGPETIVVAMYAAPLISKPVATAPANSSPPKTVATMPQTKAATSTKPSTTPKAAESKKEAPVAIESPVASSTLIIEPEAKTVSKLATLTNGSLPWLASATTLLFASSAVLFITKNSYAIHRWIRRGERYMLHHAVFDITLISLAGLCIIVSSSAGYIR